jgi:Putative collagen-binding domain of a collagenase
MILRSFQLGHVLIFSLACFENLSFISPFYAVNYLLYLSSKGMNVFSFLTNNIGGDDRNVFPYISDQPEDFDRMDCSKTAQWDVVFDHAETKGMFLHFKTQETENDQMLDGGELGNDRKLYYRELIARFGHHLALNWNLGEENTNTDAQRKAFADYFKEIDPYAHPVVMHTYAGTQEENYEPLLGYPTFDGVSLQTGQDSGFSQTLQWVNRSATAGHKWIVSFDEQSPSDSGVVPDANDPTHDGIRKNVLWANLMVRAVKLDEHAYRYERDLTLRVCWRLLQAGGAGVEYYFGYSFNNSDLTLQDFRSRDNMWNQSRYALEFFSNVPFWKMSNANERVTNNNWCLWERDSGATIVLYLPNGGTTDIDLMDLVGTFSIQWYDPRLGGDTQNGTIASLSAGASGSIGDAPYSSDQDWAVLLKCTACETQAPSLAPVETPPLVTPTPATPAPVALSTHAPAAQFTQLPVVQATSAPAAQTHTPAAQAMPVPATQNAPTTAEIAPSIPVPAPTAFEQATQTSSVPVQSASNRVVSSMLSASLAFTILLF